MTARALPEDSPPCVLGRQPIVAIAREQALQMYPRPGAERDGKVHHELLRFAGGPVDASAMRESHSGPTPSTITGAQRPDKMRDWWLTRANNATRSALRESNPLRRSALIEEARIATENAEIFDERCA